MKVIRTLIAVAILSLLLLAGCQSAETTVTTTPVPGTTTPASGTTAPVTTVSSPEPTGLTVMDDMGREVKISGIPQRIISLSPSNTEIVYALGLEDSLIGVTTYCNYPEEVQSKPQVSEFSIVDIEKIVSLQPDLILADDIHKAEVVPALEKLGFAVFIVRPGTVDEIIQDIRLIGKITGKDDRADALAASLQQRVKAVTDKVAAVGEDRPGFLYVTWHDPIWTAGGNTIMGDIITKAGGINIAGDMDGYVTLTLEEVLNRDPDIIIVMTSMGDKNDSLDYILAEPRLQTTTALKNGQVHLIDADIFGRLTPRIVDGLEQLAAMAYPEIFQQE